MRRLLPVTVLGIALWVVPSAYANTYVVNKTGDHMPGNCTSSDCTLREAVSKANSHAGGDTIVLKGGERYELARLSNEDLNAGGDLDINPVDSAALTITSSNTRLAIIDANHTDGVIDVLDGRTKFNRLKLTGGLDVSDEGGGIDFDNLQSAKILNSRISGNSATFGGGVDAGGGALTISRTKVSGNRSTGGGNGGGGISADATASGSVTISKSTISGNTSQTNAGGIYVNGPLSVKDSTISGNTTVLNGGGDGGGMSVSGGSVSLRNDTIANNRADADGGGINATTGSSTVRLNAVTIAYNLSDNNNGGVGSGGGINQKAGATYLVKNSIIARNSANTGGANGPNCFDGTANGIVSQGHNLVGNNTDCDGFLTGALGSDRVNRSNSQVGIGSLKSNGGPTKTIALKSGSQAIDHAGSDAPSKDQRGVRRNDPGGPDIGAYEKN
jgi:CSLREA domain-containing protein